MTRKLLFGYGGLASFALRIRVVHTLKNEHSYIVRKISRVFKMMIFRNFKTSFFFCKNCTYASYKKLTFKLRTCFPNGKRFKPVVEFFCWLTLFTLHMFIKVSFSFNVCLNGLAKVSLGSATFVTLRIIAV